MFDTPKNRVLPCWVPNVSGRSAYVGSFDPIQIVLYFIVFLLSLSFHESAHAWTSSRFGDDTGRMLGRITLNPVPHIDPFGTILMPLLGILGAPFALGWAKPVPVNPDNWTDRRTANILVSLAGPFSNLLLAGIFFGIGRGMLAVGVISPMDVLSLKFGISPVAGAPNALGVDPILAHGIATFLLMAVGTNIGLAIFNLFPIPPLDGSHVAEELLPYEAAQAYDQIRPYSIILLMGLAAFGVFGLVIWPIRNLVESMLLW